MIPCLGKRAKTLVVLVATLVSLSAEAAAVPIAGRVLGPDQAAIRGATVEVLPTIGSWERLRHRLAGTEPAVADRTVTADDGTFELPPQPIGLWTLRVRAEGMIEARRDLPPAWPGGTLEDLTLLRADRVLRIRVVDGHDRSVAGAEVDAMIDGLGHPWRHGEIHAAVPTDDRGEVRLPCPDMSKRGRSSRREAPIQAVARAADGPDRWRTSAVVTAEAPGLLTLRIASLEADAPATVRFVRLGRPLAGVAVLDPLGPVAISDAEGRVELPLTNPALGRDWPESLRIVTQDRVLEWPIVESQTQLQKQTLPIEIEVPAAARWSGQVVSEGGLPVADAAVFFITRASSEPQFALTDRQGHYDLPVPSAQNTLGVRAAGYLPATVRPGRGPLDAADQDLQLPKVVLRPATQVAARVVDPAGRPLPGVRAEVLVQRAQSNFTTSGDPPHARSDAEGRLVFRGLAPGTAVLALLRKDGYARREVGFAVPVPLEPTPGEAAATLTWVMEPGVEVSGRTVDEDGEPVAAAEIELKPQPTDDVPKEVRYARGLGEVHRATTGRDGLFVFPGVAGGQFRLQAEADGLLGAARLVDIEAPGPQDLGDVELAAGLALEGRVVDHQTGDAVAGLPVIAGVEYRGVLTETVTDDRGHFVLRGLPKQVMKVVAGNTEDYLGSGATVRPPLPDSLELRVERASSLSGRVVDASGAPVTNVHLKISWHHEGGGMASSSEVSSDGSFEESGRRSSSFTVVASSPEHGTGRYEGKLGTGEHLEIEVVLRPGVRLSGIVLDRGEAVSDARVYAVVPEGLSEDWRHVPPTMLLGLTDLETQVDGRGRFAFPSVEPTEIALVVAAEGYETHRQLVDLGAGGGADLAVELQRLAEIRGSVLDSFGQPIVGARVFGSSGMTHAETTTKADGTFVLAVGDLHLLRVHPPHRATLIHSDPQTLLDEETHPGSRTLRAIVPESTADVSVSVFGLDDSELAQTSLSARAELEGGWRSHASGTLDPDGNGSLRSLYPGRWTISASSGDLRRSREVDVAAGGARHVDLDFTDNVDLLLSVEIDGETPTGIQVVVEPAQGPSSSCRTDNSGRCLLSGLTTGPARLLLRGRRSDRQDALHHSQPLQITGSPEERIVIWTSRGTDDPLP